MTEANSSPRQPRQPHSPPGQPPPVLKRWDNIVKSSDDKREYRGLELSNHMKVLLVSDPDTDRSAAALDVNVGYLNDPKDMPGLAHFCEHMLFLGTEKYPEENEYSKFLADHGGSSNAATSADHTMYYFDILPDRLPEALDMFAQFFIAPLFTETSTKREVLAVNSEHMKNLKSDIWRIDQVNKHTADPTHDYNCFGTGNKATLGRLPHQRGVKTRDELLKFHDKWYSANLMCLCVFGKESLDELEDMIVNLFSAVPNWDAPKPNWTKHPYPPERCRKLLYITPVKDARSLSVDFPIPDTRKYYKNGPAHYLSHVLGHEGPGSLLSLLKSEGWCNSLVGGTRIGARGFGFFGIQVDLTEDGLQNVDKIVELVFQYIAMLKDLGVQRWIWEEQRDLMYMEFRFRDALDPRSLVTNHVHHMQDFPMEDVLSVYFILSEYKPDLIKDIMDMLSPDNVRISVIAKQFKDLCKMKEPWYGTKYNIQDIPEDKLDDWRNAKPHPKLHLPFPNEFIPTNFEIYNEYDPSKEHVPPYIIRDSHTVRTWYKPDTNYQLPKAICTFDFVTPLAYSDPLNCNLTSVWVLLLRDALQECAYAAELAGLRWNIFNAKNGITITIDGYDDKQLILLEKMVKEVCNFKTNPARLEIMKENHIRSIKNFDAEQPYQHAVYEQALCLTDNVWSKGQLLEAAELITAERLDDYTRHFIRKVHVEGLVYGNFTKERALQVATIIENTLPSDGMPLLSQQLMLSREVEMEKGTEYVRQVYNDVHRSSCTTVYYDCGLRNTRSNVALELTVQLLSEPCFNILRTQEQLGYIVFVGIRRSHGVQGLRFIIQGDKHPAYLEERIEAFLRDMEDYIQSLPDEEFHKHRGSLIAARLEKPKRMAHKASQLWGEIANQLYNFNRAQVEADHLSSMSKADFLEYYWRHFAGNSAHRKKLAVHVISMAEGGAGYIAKHGAPPDLDADWLPSPDSKKFKKCLKALLLDEFDEKDKENEPRRAHLTKEMDRYHGLTRLQISEQIVSPSGSLHQHSAKRTTLQIVEHLATKKHYCLRSVLFNYHAQHSLQNEPWF